MAINETISTGNKYRRLKDATNKVWQRISFWTKASDVEFDNGTTAQDSLGNITGITDSVNSNSSTVAASANAVYTLNSNLTDIRSDLTGVDNIKLYVGSDGKLHWVDKAGADTALNFSNYDEGYQDGINAWMSGTIVDNAVCSGAGAGCSIYTSTATTWSNSSSYNKSFTIPKTLNGGYLYALIYSNNCWNNPQYGGSGSSSVSFTLKNEDTTVASASYSGTSTNNTYTIDFMKTPYPVAGTNLTLAISASAEVGRGTHSDSGCTTGAYLSFTAKYKVPSST